MSNLSDLKDFSDGKFFIADKPPNLLSHETTSIVGRLLCNKAGHSGTLDPKVSGVLIVGLGKATRLLRFLTEQPKTYVGIAKFKRRMTKAEIEEIFSKLTGEITQTPPKESAVVKKPRKRRVYSLEALELERDRVLFKAKVEKGTYIRVLCKQMGAEMEDLRRIESGGIGEENAVILQKLHDAINTYKNGNGKPLESLLKTPEEVFIKSSLPKIEVNEKAETNIRKGAPVYAPGIISVEGEVKPGRAVAVFSIAGKLIGVARAANEFKGQKKGLIAKMERVHLN